MIPAHTCPYCGAAYTIAARGCVARCPLDRYVRRLIREAIEAEEAIDVHAPIREP